MTLVIAWLCNPGSHISVVGVKDLDHLGHCQKSGCRNGPDQVNSPKRYHPPMPNQRESREEIPPSILLAEFAFFFGLLMIALYVLGRVCRLTQRALIAAKEALSLFGGRKRKRGRHAASAVVRGPFVSTGSDSEMSYSSSSSLSTGSSSYDSESSIGDRGSDMVKALTPMRSQKRRSIDDGVDREVGSIMSEFVDLLRRSSREEKKDHLSYGGGSLDEDSLRYSIDRGGIRGNWNLRKKLDSAPRAPKTLAPRRLLLDVPKGRVDKGVTAGPPRHHKLRSSTGSHHHHKPTSGNDAIRMESALRLAAGPHYHHKPTSDYVAIRMEGNDNDDVVWTEQPLTADWPVKYCTSARRWSTS